VKRINITLLLVAAFCLLAAVLFIVGWQGIRRLRNQDAQMQNIIYDRWQEGILSNRAYRLSSENSRLTLLIFLTDDRNEIKKLVVQRAANSQSITELAQIIGARLDTDSEKQLFALTQAKRALYIESYQQALSLLLTEHKVADARKMMEDVVQPNLVAYHSAWDAFNQLEANEIEQTIKQSKIEFAADRRNFLLMLVGAGLFTSVIAIYTVMRLDREIADRGRAEHALRGAYDQLEQRVLDRTSELANSNETLRLLNSAVIQSKEAILITDAELDLPGPRIIFVNPAFTQMTGYTAEEALGKTPRILQGPLTDKTVLKRLRETLEQGEVFEGEAINYRKDGTKFNLEWQVTPIREGHGEISHFVAIQRDITERKRSEARFRLLVDSNVQCVLFWNENGEITGANDAFLNLVHSTREDLEAGRINWMALTPPEYAHLDRHALEEIAATGSSAPYEKEYVLTDGTRVPILLGAAAYADNPDEGVCFVLDLTERKRLETHLLQSQKMETVGRLAGGVAHEFNSILTAIIGQSELLRRDVPAGSALAKSAIEISRAADRAATLTRQLLAYGRKQILLPENLDLNSVLGEMETSLRHLVGPGTDLRIVPTAGLKAVKADVGQIEQVIMNVVMNAIDAMPDGGKLTLETANVTLDHEYVSHFQDLKAGEYVMLAITDTGTGMSADIKAHVFEPFFSTKSVGPGNGLGLSTSYGIIKQSGGHIGIYSEFARGTIFKIYLPQVEQQTKIPVRLDAPDLPRGTETILLVEDDPALREMASSLLERLGYTVLKAANGIEALSLQHQQDNGQIDLLFTDVVMPHMSGKELAERVLALYPRTKILFTSAYTENAIVHQGILSEGVTLLQKPFTPSALAQKLRKVLDRSPLLLK
jgi:PAS domain S-box-containing protein